MNQKPLLTRSFVTLCAVGFLGRLSYEMARSPLSPLLAQKLGAPPVIIGLIVASVTIIGIFVKLPSGALSDVFGFRTLMLVGGVVKMVGPFLYLPVNAFLELIPIRLFHGLATATYAPAAAAWVAAMDPRNRARRLGIYSAAENIGIAIIFAAQGAASLLSRPSMGELSDRIGRKPVILIGLLSCTIGLAAIPHTGSLLGLAVLSALFGFGWGSVTPSTSAMIADLCKEQHLGSAMGVFGSIWDTGHATGPILAGVLVGAIGYGGAFGTVAALILVGALLFAVAVREPDPVVGA